MKTRQDKIRQDKPGQDRTRQDKTRQDKTRQGKYQDIKRRYYSLLSSLVTLGILGMTPFLPSVKAERICVCVCVCVSVCT